MNCPENAELRLEPEILQICCSQQGKFQNLQNKQSESVITGTASLDNLHEMLSSPVALFCNLRTVLELERTADGPGIVFNWIRRVSRQLQIHLGKVHFHCVRNQIWLVGSYIKST